MANTPQAPGSPPRRRLWNDPRLRALVFQAITLAGVAWLGWTLFQNTLANLEARGIETGFGFLDEPANFGVLVALIPYNPSMSYFRVFLVGLVNTLVVSAVGIVLCTILGFVVGIARLSSNWLVAKLALVYIEIFRNIPVLLQLFFWYFVVLRSVPTISNSWSLGGVIFLNNRGLYLPRPLFQPGAELVLAAFLMAIVVAVVWARWARRRQERTGYRPPVLWPALVVLIGLPVLMYFVTGRPVTWSVPVMQTFNFAGGMVILPEFAALVAALTMYTAAFVGEIVRSGILAVSEGQKEAARSLGLRPGLALRLVVIPQALRVIIPQQTSQYLNLAKNSSLATAIGYPDLVAVFMGTTLNQTGQAVEIVAMTMAVYLTLSLLISAAMNLYNRAVALKGGSSA